MLYAGPNKTDNIKAASPDLGQAMSYGVFNGIAGIMLKALNFFYRVSGNYGIAIILLTICISIALFPLTRKSLRSMREMQKIQPEVEKIRKAHSDNPQKMNKEIMALYKEHKANPLGGCLPMFLQFPVFITLYQVLVRNVELKGARFLWIKDLAMPDAAFTLPRALPLIGANINILPVLMIIAMVFQQKISQVKGAEMSEQQRMMTTIFPLMLGFIFYNLPSGLVLYWLTNTLLTLFVHEVLLKSHKVS